MKISSLFTQNSKLNKLLDKIFHFKLIFHGKYGFYTKQARAQCGYCKSSMVPLNICNNQKFSYKKDDQLSVQCQSKIETEDIKVYGWIIERYDKKYGYWSEHWNHKVYRTRESALDALNQQKQFQIENSKKEKPILIWNDFKKYEFKISPVYTLGSSLTRQIQIEQILN